MSFFISYIKETMEIPKIPKKYNCNSCDYHTSNKKDFDKHNFTLKHINGTKSQRNNTMRVTNIYKIS